MGKSYSIEIKFFLKSDTNYMTDFSNGKMDMHLKICKNAR